MSRGTDGDGPVAENCTAQYDDGRLQRRGSGTIPWDESRDRLAACSTYWLSTLAPGDRPQPRPVLGVWLDGEWCSTASPATRKARNLAERPRCAVAAGTDGVDLVLEGEAVAVTDRATLELIAAAYHDKYGWPVEVDGTAFRAPYGAPTAGPPPYEAFRVVPEVVFALGTDEQHAPQSTRYRFTAPPRSGR